MRTVTTLAFLVVIPAAPRTPESPLDPPCSPLLDGNDRNLQFKGDILDREIVGHDHAALFECKCEDVKIGSRQNGKIAGSPGCIL